MSKEVWKARRKQLLEEKKRLQERLRRIETELRVVRYALGERRE